ncbi:hypothetical protein KR044_006371 [Drosophila immigrans]|nr:hypothetical protein KR044_006371 [Drosophila immigrans]
MFKDEKNKMDINSFIGAGSYETFHVHNIYGIRTAEFIALSKGMQQLLDYPDDFKFDVIINDYTMGPYLLGFVHKFNYPPVVGITAFHNTPLVLDFMSNSYFPALIPYYSTMYNSKLGSVYAKWQKGCDFLLTGHQHVASRCGQRDEAEICRGFQAIARI